MKINIFGGYSIRFLIISMYFFSKFSKELFYNYIYRERCDILLIEIYIREKNIFIKILLSLINIYYTQYFIIRI